MNWKKGLDINHFKILDSTIIVMMSAWDIGLLLARMPCSYKRKETH
jgi:hypothetical protein